MKGHSSVEESTIVKNLRRRNRRGDCLHKENLHVQVYGRACSGSCLRVNNVQCYDTRVCGCQAAPTGYKLFILQLHARVTVAIGREITSDGRRSVQVYGRACGGSCLRINDV